MAKKVQSNILREPVIKGTSIGRGKLKMQTMNKHKKRCYKKYRGQG